MTGQRRYGQCSGMGAVSEIESSPADLFLDSESVAHQLDEKWSDKTEVIG